MKKKTNSSPSLDTISSGFFQFRIQIFDGLSLLWFLILAIVVYTTVWDYGISWDESFRWAAGEEKLNYYRAFFSGAGVPTVTQDLYPGLFDLTLALLQTVSPLTTYQTGHLLSTLFGGMALIGTWLIARTLASPRAAFLAVVLLTLTPRFYGHMFFNPKDIPFAGLYALTVWLGILSLRNSPGRSWWMCIALGITIGLAMGVRTAGLLTLIYLAAFVGYELWQQKETTPCKLWWKKVGREWLWGSLVLLIALLTLLPWWPYAQQNLFQFLTESARSTAGFAWSGEVLYLGDRMQGTEIPFHYFPVWLGITLPPAVLVLFVCAIAMLALDFWRSITSFRFSNKTLPPVSPVFFLAVCMGFPLLYSILTKPVVYDGLRHLLFIIPLILPLAAIAWDRLLSTKGVFHSVIHILLIVSLLWTSLSMIRLHPYQYTYFNPLIGGLRGAHGQFELDYWGLSYREAAEALAQYAENLDPNDPRLPIRVTTIPPFQNIPVSPTGRRVVPPPLLATTFYSDRMLAVNGDENPDFYIGLNRLDFAHLMDGPIIYSAERFGTPLAIVRKISKPSPPSPPERDEEF